MNTKKEMIGGVPGNVLGMMADLCHKLQHGKIKPIELEFFLKKQNPFTVETVITEWQRFYRDFSVKKVDFSNVKIPEKQPGFDRLIIIAKGLTSNQVFEACQNHFPCWRYAEDLDGATKDRNDREPKEHYAIWVCDRQEADEELKNFSSDDLKKESIKGITLLERLLLELKYWDETGKHLDEKNITLCAGSRDSRGFVPDVSWDDGKLKVNWCDSRNGSSNLRVRAAVSS